VTPPLPPSPLPPRPLDLLPEQRARGSVLLRYEDVSQEGRVMVGALPNAFSGPIWGDLLGSHSAIGTALAQGIIPILVRLVLVGAPGPFSIANPFDAEACFDLAHTLAPRADGAPAEGADRILLRLWGSLRGPHGTLRSRTPAGTPPSLAGEAYAEHVFTRLFAPPEQRKVRTLQLPGVAPVPGPRVEVPPPEALLSLPDGAVALDTEPVADDAAVVFSLGHTDSNQHVNSLVYPRLFEEAALRRLAAHGEGTALLARRVECAYRKPGFAGDRARFWSRAFVLGGARGAVGALFPDGINPGSGARASFCARVLWEP
jgi:hypothetical protein